MTELPGRSKMIFIHLLSSSSVLTRLSSPLLHVPNAAWKSVSTIICSAAVSNMLNIFVNDDVSGGMHTEPKLCAGPALAEQLLIDVES